MDDGFSTLMPLLEQDGKLSGLTAFGIGSGITDKGMQDFANIIVMGALANLLRLLLSENPIGDQGLTSLADACTKGAMASLKELMADNEENPELKAACQARGITLALKTWGPWRSCKYYARH